MGEHRGLCRGRTVFGLGTSDVSNQSIQATWCYTPLLEDTGNLLVPAICLYEVFKKVNAVADEPRTLQAVAQMKQGRVVDLTEAIALHA